MKNPTVFNSFASGTMTGITTVLTASDIREISNHNVSLGFVTFLTIGSFVFLRPAFRILVRKGEYDLGTNLFGWFTGLGIGAAAVTALAAYQAQTPLPSAPPVERDYSSSATASSLAGTLPKNPPPVVVQGPGPK